MLGGNMGGVASFGVVDSKALKCPSKLIQIYPNSAEKIQTNPITYRYRSRSARAGTITNFFTLLWSCLDTFG